MINSCPYTDVKNVADYIAKEINTNQSSPEAKMLKQLNSRAIIENCRYEMKPRRGYQCDSPFVQALKLWYQMVKGRGPWDHKPMIRGQFGKYSCNKSLHNPQKYFFDIWSNIHYGYIGKYVGFSEWTLLNGAGAGQVLETNGVKNFFNSWKHNFFSIDLIGHFDDIKDQGAIKVGFRLFDNYSSSITRDMILGELERSYFGDKKPMAIDSCEYKTTDPIYKNIA